MHDVRIKFRIWVEWNNKEIIGPGVYDILKSIQETRSMSSAARRLGFSYKSIWSYLKRIEDLLGVPLVETSRGGRERGKTELAEVGQLLLQYYEELNNDINNIISNWQNKFQEIINSLEQYKAKAEEREEEIPFYSEE